MIQKSFLIAAILFAAIPGFAQKSNNPIPFAKSITPADLKKHLSVIASAEMEGRDTPSPGLEKAADYITEHFKKLGLTPGNNGAYRQTYKLSKDSITSLDLGIAGKSYTAYTDFAPLLLSGQDIDLHFTDYVFACYGIVDDTRNDYANLDVKGKLVVLLNGAPKNYKSDKQGRLSPSYLGNKLAALQKLQPAAVLVVMDQVPARMNRRATYRPVPDGAQENSTAPVFAISASTAASASGQTLDNIKAAIDNGSVSPGINQGNTDITAKVHKESASASNVLGVLEGTDKKDEYLFITGHYDHVGKDAQGRIYYGADDDGSGTVSVLEMAEAFALAKKAGKGPRRTIVFMTVSGEEKGLWGSEYYSDHPIFPLDKTTADLNIDMIGRVGGDYMKDHGQDSLNYVYIIGDDKLSTDLTPVTEAANSKYTKLVLDRKFNDPNDPERIYYRSDHYNFARKGVPIIFYFDGVHADYHKPTDTVDKINFDMMSRRAQLVFYTAWEIANREAMLKKDLKLQ